MTHERVWAASFLQGICGVKSDDIFYINLPLYHSAGFLIGMTGAIERGHDPGVSLVAELKSANTPNFGWLRNECFHLH